MYCSMHISIHIHHQTCLHKNATLCLSKCSRYSVNTPAPPLGLVPSAQLRKANYSRQSLPSPLGFLPSSPFVPLLAAAHAAYSQISYIQAKRVELHMRDGVKRREGIEKLLMGSLLALMGMITELMLRC